MVVLCCISRMSVFVTKTRTEARTLPEAFRKDCCSLVDQLLSTRCLRFIRYCLVGSCLLVCLLDIQLFIASIIHTKNEKTTETPHHLPPIPSKMPPSLVNIPNIPPLATQEFNTEYRAPFWESPPIVPLNTRPSRRGSESNASVTVDTWELNTNQGGVNTPTASKVPLLGLVSTQQVQNNPESVDRPLFLSVLNVTQLLEPDLYFSLNPLGLIGTLAPEIPHICKEAIDALNDMIASIWEKDTDIAIPILVPGGHLDNSERGYVRPVQGLRVLTRVVSVSSSTRTEDAILEVKSNYKYQDFLDCIEAGRTLIKLSWMGRLVTKPSRSSLRLPRSVSGSRPTDLHDDDSQRLVKIRRRSRSQAKSSRTLSRSGVDRVGSSEGDTQESSLARLRRVLGI